MSFQGCTLRTRIFAFRGPLHLQLFSSVVSSASPSFIPHISRKSFFTSLTMPRGTLDVLLADAKGLKNTDPFKKMDPYVILAVRDQVKKSSVASGQGSEPAWNETFLFTITDGLEQLSIKIMDSDVGDDDFVGELIIPLEPLFTGGNIPVKAYTVKRGEKEKGEIRIGLSFFPEA